MGGLLARSSCPSPSRRRYRFLIVYILQDTPQQQNGYDCGVFTCQFLEALSRGEEEFGFTQDNMSYLRRKMVWEIGHVKLRDDP